MHRRLVVLLSTVLCAAEPTVDRLKKDVEFLASDKLKGRGTGTPELERAADYIAQRFRKIGLQPASARGYFQSLPVQADMERTVDVHVDGGLTKFTIGPENSVAVSVAPGTLSSVPIVKVDREYAKTATGQPLQGKAVVVTDPIPINSLGTPVLAIFASEQTRRYMQMAARVNARLAFEAVPQNTNVVYSADPEVIKWVASLPAGPVAGVTASITAKAQRRGFDLRNVVAVLPGSDSVLRNTYVIVSAHYDGLGETGTGTDRIRNGATDNASGTAAMLAVAEKLSRQKQRPKRSVVFAAWTGEETGATGSRYYAFLPLFPLASTVANINIEQPGRHDGEGGAGPKRMLVTGHTYSDVGRIVTEAAKTAGIEAYAAPNAFFTRSDNVFLARAGVPAHTVGASLEFPDYHTVADSAEKLDYGNMALLSDAIAASVLAIANSDKAPEWNAAEPATAPYRRAQAATKTH